MAKEWMKRLWTGFCHQREELSPLLPSDSGITEKTGGPLSGTEITAKPSFHKALLSEEEREEESTGGKTRT